MMVVLYIFSAFYFAVSVVSAAVPCKGCVNIDQFSYEKVINRFEVTLLKFDDVYTYGYRHDNFTNVANDITHNKEVLVGQVPIKYYGEKSNQEFSKRFGITSKEDLPILLLFVRGHDEPFIYSKSMRWIEKDIRKFILDKANVYVTRRGCVETFDKLAVKFSTSSDKESVLKEAQQQFKKLKSKRQANAAKIYLKVMKKIIEVGDSFIAQEDKRLDKILSGKVSEKKKEEIALRKNILRSFDDPILSPPTPSAKTEL